MRNKVARGLRNIAKAEIDEGIKYLEQTFHHVYTGKDAQGNKTFAEVTDPIRLAICTRSEYKRRKNDYKTNRKG